MNIRWPTCAGTLAALITLASGGTQALELGNQFQLHSYADLSHEKSNVDTSDMHLGDRETSSNISLVGVWQATDRAKVWTQLFRSSELGKIRVDWAFVDYQTSGAQTLRLGRVRQPLGLHNEMRDVQELRPTASMPYMYDEELALVDESFDGASVEQNFQIGASTVKLEVYGASKLQSGGAEVARGSAAGARLILETPFEGLSLRGSVYSARLSRNKENALEDKDILEHTQEDTRQRKRAWAVAVHYLPGQGHVDVQAELARGFLYDHRVSTWYVQAAVPLADHWKAAARFERIVTDTSQRGDDAFQERRLVLGIAYTIKEHFGLRIEQQFHRGYGIPVVHETLEAGTGRPSWKSTVLSINYQF